MKVYLLHIIGKFFDNYKFRCFCKYKKRLLARFERNVVEFRRNDIKNKIKGIFVLSPYIMEPNTEDMMRKRVDEYVEISKKPAEKYNCIAVGFQKMYADYCMVRHCSYIVWDRINPN